MRMTNRLPGSEARVFYCVTRWQHTFTVSAGLSQRNLISMPIESQSAEPVVAVIIYVYERLRNA